MSRATFRFYGDLAALLPPRRRSGALAVEFTGTPSVKDVVESLGVPHTEVELIVADGTSVDFGWRLHDGARVAVYPWFAAIAIADVSRVRPPPLATLRFVADGHLGRLARYLRMAGFDTTWLRDPPDEELARRSRDEGRVLLTRDRGLLKRREVSHGHLVRANEAPEQLTEVAVRFDLARAVAPFSRCLRCNAPLEAVALRDVAERLPPRVRERQLEFWRCPACGRIYWAGTHTRRMQLLLRRIAEAGARGAPPLV